jgi:hypothetical protein
MATKTNKAKQTMAQVQEQAAQLEQQLAQVKQALEQQLMQVQQANQQQQAQAQQALEDQLKQVRQDQEQHIAQIQEASAQQLTEAKQASEQLTAAMQQQKQDFERQLQETKTLLEKSSNQNSESLSLVLKALDEVKQAAVIRSLTPANNQETPQASNDASSSNPGAAQEKNIFAPPSTSVGSQAMSAAPSSSAPRSSSIAAHLLETGWNVVSSNNPYMIPPQPPSAFVVPEPRKTTEFAIPNFTSTVNLAGTGSAQDPITLPQTPAPVRPVNSSLLPNVAASGGLAALSVTPTAQHYFAMPSGLQTVKMPEPFNGSGDFRSFRGDFQRCAIANNWDEATQIRMIASCLTGYAGTTYLEWHARGELNNLSMVQLWNKMEFKFYDAEADAEEAKRKLRARKQKPNESIDSYVEVFLNLAAEANVSNDKKLVRQFKDNILPSLVTPVATALATNKDIDFKTAVAIVREMESSTLKSTHAERKRKIANNSDDDEEIQASRRVHAISARDAHDRNSGFDSNNRDFRGDGTRSSSDLRRLNDTIADIQRQLVEYRQKQESQRQYLPPLPPPPPSRPPAEHDGRRPFHGFCHKCGMRGHMANDCRSQSKFCSFCNRRSHSDEECRSRPKSAPQATTPKDVNPAASPASRQGN